MNVQELENVGWVFLSSDKIKSVPTGSGVYGLIMNDTIIYIGKSKCLFSRLTTHLSTKKGAFNTIMYMLVDEQDISELEKFYIRLFLPTNNVMLMPVDRSKHTPLKSLFRKPFIVHHYGYPTILFKVFRRMARVEYVCKEYNIPIYIEAGRKCISLEDSKKFIERMNTHIQEYMENCVSWYNPLSIINPHMLDFHSGEELTLDQYYLLYRDIDDSCYSMNSEEKE